MKVKISHKLKSLLFGTVSLALATSCLTDEEAGLTGTGSLSLSISNATEEQSTTNGRSLASGKTYRYLIVSIKDEEGVYVLNNERLQLTQLGEGYFTDNILLDIGEYTIEDFIVLDSSEKAVLICPKEGSSYAEYVENPLSVSCTITKDETIIQSLEVIDASLGDPTEFGYAILTFNEVKLVALDRGLIAYYDFSGDATDKSGNGHHGTVNGATLTSGRKGAHDGAYRFNGSSDYINTGIDDSVLVGLESFSFGCWVKFDSLNNSRQVMISNTVDGNAMWALRLEDNNMISTGIVNQRDSSTVRWTQVKGNNTDQAVKQHNWYHLVTVYDGEMMRLYVNGVEMLAKAAIGPLVRQSSGTRTVYLGCPVNKRADYMLEGVLDDVRMYSRALSPLEVERWYVE